MHTSAYYNFTATDKGGANDTNYQIKRSSLPSREPLRFKTVSPASLVTSTSSSTSNSSLNQFNSLNATTPLDVATSGITSAIESPSSTSPSSSSTSSSSGFVQNRTDVSNNKTAYSSNLSDQDDRLNRLEFTRNLHLTSDQPSSIPTLTRLTHVNSRQVPSDHQLRYEPSRSPQICHSYTLHSLEPKSLKPFKSRDEYLEAMKEDLAEWLNRLYPDLDLTTDNFLAQLETGTIICRHANCVTQMGKNFLHEKQVSPSTSLSSSGSDNSCELNNDSVSKSIHARNGTATSYSSPPPACRVSKSFSTASSLNYARSLSICSNEQRDINWFMVKTIPYKRDPTPGTFFARDNICQFILWCRSLNIRDCLLFETDDLVARKNVRSFILCLLEVARIGFKVGMPTPLIIQLEQEIDQEIENEAKLQKELEAKLARETADHSGDSLVTDSLEENSDDVSKYNRHLDDTVNDQEENKSVSNEPKTEKEEEPEEEEEHGPKPQVITNDLLSLHERVVQLLCQCTCPTQFPMVRIGDNGKYKVGDKLIIFVRILRRHIMVRVGGGWQELSEFLRLKDPCRSRQLQPHSLSYASNNATCQHNQSSRVSSPSLKSRLGDSSYQLNKSYIPYRGSSMGAHRTISGSASMSWLSHNG